MRAARVDDNLSPVDRVLARLEGHNVKRLMSGGYTAQCPCQRHKNGDKRNSLGIAQGDDGRALLCCRTGGTIEEIAAGLGLEVTDLFASKPINPRARVGKSVSAKLGAVVWAYDYTDEQGNLLYQNVRYKLPDGGKDFRQRAWNGAGGWLYTLNGVRRVLYRLPEVIEAIGLGRTVFIVEGEKDADRLCSLGFTATTSSSASSWRDEFAASLVGADVILVPDRDKAGDGYRDKVGVSLHGKAARVRLLTLPVEWRENHGLDVSDWLDHGGTAEDFERLADAAPDWTPGIKTEAHTSGRVKIISAAELQKKTFPPVKWAVPDLLPEGLTLLAGRPKQGKSWLAFSIGLGIALGGKVLGQVQVEGGSVLYLALEDRERRLQDRMNLLLQQENAPERLHMSVEWPRFDDGGIQEIEAWIQGRTDARLVIVDTLAWVKPPSRKGANQYEEDSKAVRAIKDLAERNSVAVLVVHHTRKAASEDPVDQISGTLGIAGAADGWLILQRKRGSDSAFLHVDGRDIKESRELAIEWHQDSAAWTLIGDAEELRLSNAQKEVIEILRANDNVSMSAAALCKALQETSPDLTLNAVKMRLRKMADEGRIKIERHKYSIPEDHPLTTRANTIRPHHTEREERESGDSE